MSGGVAWCYFIPSLLSVACICPVSNMRAVLEEAAAATATNQRLSQFFAPIVLPQTRLVVLCWDGVNLHIETPGDFRDSRQCYSTKDSRHSICRLKAIDSEGRAVFSLSMSMSSSPRGCEESVMSYQLELETMAGQTGGLEDMLTGGGLPGYTIRHVFDKGGVLYIRSHVGSTNQKSVCVDQWGDSPMITYFCQVCGLRYLMSKFDQ